MSRDTNVPELVINKLTQAQYNSAEKSETELYLITDAKIDASEIEGLSSLFSEWLKDLYPVGAIYQGTMAACPLQTLMTGTQWQVTTDGRINTWERTL